MAVSLRQNLISAGEEKFLSAYFLIICVFAISCYIITVLFIPKKFIKKSIMFAVMMCLILGTVFIAYITSPDFEREVNMVICPAVEHYYIISNQQHEVPLPLKTALRYRTSDTQAVYTSKSSVNEISDFYLSLAEDESFLKSGEDSSVNLSFKFQGDILVVTVEEMNNRRILFVDVDD